MRLTKRRLEKLSDIASDVGLVALASVVLPAVLDKFDLVTVAWGLAGTLFFITMTDTLLMYLILAVIGLGFVLMALPTMLRKR